MNFGETVALIKAIGGGSSGGGGGGGGALVVNVSVTDNGDDTYTFTCGKTAGEMYEAAPNLAFCLDDGDGIERVGQLYLFGHADGYGYTFGARGLIDVGTFSQFTTNTDSPSEYPTYLLDQGGN